MRLLSLERLLFLEKNGKVLYQYWNESREVDPPRLIIPNRGMKTIGCSDTRSATAAEKR